MNDRKIIIATEFSDTPGGRYKSDGPFSGELFREEHLLPTFDSLKQDECLLIDLDGGFGYGISFLEEAFGGLARLRSPQSVGQKLKFKSDDEPELIPLIEEYIANAQK